MFKKNLLTIMSSLLLISNLSAMQEKRTPLLEREGIAIEMVDLHSDSSDTDTNGSSSSNASPEKPLLGRKSEAQQNHMASALLKKILFNKYSKAALELAIIHTITFSIGFGSIPMQDTVFAPLTASVFAALNQSELMLDRHLLLQLATHWTPASAYYLATTLLLTPAAMLTMSQTNLMLLYGAKSCALICGLSGVNAIAKTMKRLFGRGTAEFSTQTDAEELEEIVIGKEKTSNNLHLQ